MFLEVMLLKKTIFFAFCTLLILSFFSCYGEDFAPYSRYSKKVDIVIETKIKSLSDIVSDIDKIAQKQQSNLILTSVTLIFSGKEECNNATGIVIFEYTNWNEKLNQKSKMNIYYNMNSKTVEKFDWEKGHRKRVNILSGEEIGDKYLSVPIAELFFRFNQKPEYLNKIETVDPQIKIILAYNQLSAYLFDNDKPDSAYLFNYDFSYDGYDEEIKKWE